MNKQVVVFLCNKEEWESDTYKNVDESQKQVEQRIQTHKKIHTIPLTQSIKSGNKLDSSRYHVKQ